MRTFRTTIKRKDARGDLFLVAVITTRALTRAQAERQALESGFVVRDHFGQVVDSPNLIWLTAEQ